MNNRKQNASRIKHCSQLIDQIDHFPIYVDGMLMEPKIFVHNNFNWLKKSCFE